jgi:hypothetical protein
MQYRVCRVADHFQDDAPHVRARLPTKAESEQHEEDSNVDELGAGLCCRLRIEMTMLEGGLEVDLQH